MLGFHRNICFDLSEPKKVFFEMLSSSVQYCKTQTSGLSSIKFGTYVWFD